MAGLKIFVSSTCHDLTEERNQLRKFIIGMGHEPILSEYNEVLYEFNEHTHASCVKEVSNADIVVLIIGTRFGGVAIKDAKRIIDINEIQKKIHNININEIFNLIDKEKEEEIEKAKKDEKYKVKKIGFSITHYEVLKAIEKDIPLYVFINERVDNFYDFYGENRQTGSILKFPGMDEESTKYLFEFITILKRRYGGNSLIPYKNYSDIENGLRSQMALKFRSYVINEREQRRNSNLQSQQINTLKEEFEDLKVAVISAIQDTDTKEVAQGVANYRHLYEILRDFSKLNSAFNEVALFTKSKVQFDDIVKDVGFTDIVSSDDNNIIKDYLVSQSHRKYRRGERKDIYMISGDRYYYLDYYLYLELKRNWAELVSFKDKSRETIYQALNNSDKQRDRDHRLYILREGYTSFQQWIKELEKRKDNPEKNVFTIDGDIFSSLSIST